MITHDDVVQAHEQSYRVMRAGAWHRRVGLAALTIGIAPVVVYTVAIAVGALTGRRAQPLGIDTGTLVFFAVFGCTAVGGFVQRRTGAVMHEVAGTRQAERVRRACGVSALGALCSSAPALFLIGSAGWTAVSGGGFRVGMCGLLCAAPLSIPLWLVVESGWLWLRYPAAVDVILEGRVALQPQARPPRVAPPPPAAPPIDVDADDGDGADGGDGATDTGIRFPAEDDPDPPPG
ncbi:MAG: hypothetical protein ACYTGX_19435 [Planctomycetota bacterium]